MLPAVVGRTEVDGVPVFWVDDPGPFTAGLVLGMGVLDETFRTAGVGHAVEHLALSVLGRTHLDFTGQHRLTETEFTATGPVEEVLAFLEQVCRGLTSLPMDRLCLECGVMAAEASRATGPADAVLLALRYGYDSLGLAPLDVVPPSSIGEADVLEHVERLVTTGNAAVYLSAPPPPGLRVPLPRGPRPERAAPLVRGPAGPGWVPVDSPLPGLGVVGKDTVALRVAGRVLADRCRETLRRNEALVYDLAYKVVAPGDGTVHLSFGPECRREQSGRVAGRLWEIACELADRGPGDDDLAHDLAGLRAALADPRSVAGEAYLAASEHVAGRERPARSEVLAQAEALTPEDVRLAFAEALAGGYLVVPDGTRPSVPLAQVPGCAASRAVPEDADVLKRRRFRSAAPPGTALFLLPDGVGLRDEDGDVHVVRWDDCVGVGVDGEVRVVTGRDRCWVLVDPADWRDGWRAVRHVDAGVDPGLRYALQHDDPLPQLRLMG